MKFNNLQIFNNIFPEQLQTLRTIFKWHARQDNIPLLMSHKYNNTPDNKQTNTVNFEFYFLSLFNNICLLITYLPTLIPVCMYTDRNHVLFVLCWHESFDLVASTYVLLMTNKSVQMLT